MVAPNGARRTKSDHPALPVTLPEILETARSCFEAGAGGIHAHVRDAEGRHVLDAGLYRELISEMGHTVPEMLVQITTESAGIYQPPEQRALVMEVRPQAVSAALKEIVSDGELRNAGRFYNEVRQAGISLQHILYEPDEITHLARLIEQGVIPGDSLQLLFVLGRYSANQESEPEQIDPFVDTLAQCQLVADWAVCAFGKSETDCLARAFKLGGKARVGFENNFFNRDGSRALNNAERVVEIVKLLNN